LTLDGPPGRRGSAMLGGEPELAETLEGVL
jgi:hypothetical protein